jgi:hypothetical protein
LDVLSNSQNLGIIGGKVAKDVVTALIVIERYKTILNLVATFIKYYPTDKWKGTAQDVVRKSMCHKPRRMLNGY